MTIVASICLSSLRCCVLFGTALLVGFVDKLSGADSRSERVNYPLEFMMGEG